MKKEAASRQIEWQAIHRESEGRKVMLDTALSMHTSIYHMLPWEYARQQLETNRLRLSPVRQWTDPFERWWCNILFERAGGLLGTNPYGQCWTTGKYDEPRWRMAGFDRPRPTVRIRSSVSALLQAGKHLIKSHNGSLYIGAVRYRSEERLIARAAAVHAGAEKNVTRMAASMLHYKRKQFQFENEIRVIWLDKQPEQAAFHVNIDIPGTITQIMTSPYATSEEHQVVRTFADELGLQAKQSGILWAPKMPPSD